MADDPQVTGNDQIVMGSQDKVYSPSPEPGQPAPKRRVEDTASYTFEWSLLLIAILTWGSSTLVEVSSQYSTWDEMMQPKVLLTQLGQLMGTIVAVVSAKRIR